MPQGATPIDFAYRVHTDIGNKCVGAKVNGKLKPLTYKLQTGEIIEILTSKNSTGPSKDWLNVVVSSQAKSKIKQYFKKEQKDSNILQGRELLEKEVRKKGYDSSKILVDDWLEEISEKNNLLSIDDLYAAIGYGTINIQGVLPKLEKRYEEKYREDLSFDDLSDEEVQTKKKTENTDNISIDDLSNLESKFAKCCNPVPGDKIVGYITMGRGITIHRIDCPNVANIENKERLIAVKWDLAEKSKYQVKINVLSTDSPGYLADLTQTISKEGINVIGINARPTKDLTFNIGLIVEITEKEDLNKLFAAIRKIKGTIDVYRVKN